MDNSAQEYEIALDYLYSFINFEHKRLDRYKENKLDPERPFHLMNALGNPHTRFPALHIAGTKGKGSVAAMSASALQAAGYTVGLYTSPHVQDFRERIRILTPQDADGRIPPADFVRLMAQIRAIEPKVPGITWFEILTALAFLHFADQVDIAVVEVGLGGRLDATNVLTPLVSVITSLSLDHTYFLGNTLAQIAYEKGGIIKPGVPVVTADQPAAALDKLAEIATERGCPLRIVGRDYTCQAITHGPTGQEIVVRRTQPPATWPLHVSLAGPHQQQNATVAVAALDHLRPTFPRLTDTAVATGLAGVVWPGRLEILHQSAHTPTLLLDCAHNEDSADKLGRALKADYQYDRLWLIFGVSADKDIPGMMRHLLPLAYRTIATVSIHPRATSAEDLVRLAAELGFTIDMAADVETAVAHAWHSASPQDLICVTGSIFIVGDLLNRWERLQSQLNNSHRKNL